MIRYALIAIIIILNFRVVASFAGTLPLMRISVENTERHVQTQAVKRFADEIKNKLQGRIDVRFFSNARLFRDQDVIQALAQGKVEMAVPGTWHVSRFEPNVEIFLLPLFYGRPAHVNYKVIDGPVGRAITTRLERNLKLKTLGRWIDLGHAHLFCVGKKIQRHEDIYGMRVRVAGGEANRLRIAAMGGRPTIIPWPDLPEYLLQGRLDAVLTSYETIKSARLWEKGIKHAFEDREYFPQYIPLLGLSFWNKLGYDMQRILIDTWEKYVDDAREEAEQAQINARDILVKNGVDIIIPDPAQMEAWRQKLLAGQDEFVQKLKIDPALVEKIMKDF